MHSSVMNEVTTQAPDVVETSLVLRVLGVAREIQTRLEAGLDHIGLSPGKACLLNTLAKAGEPLPLSELADRNRCVRSNVTQLIDRLEEDGLVRRVDDPEDRRVCRASLTTQGRTAYVEATRVIGVQDREIERTLGNADTEVFRRTLDRLSRME
jgi:DNA-binding MarR family transcriptional regulator